MPNALRVNRPDGTSFVGVASAQITEQGSGAATSIVFTGVGWCIVAGSGPQVRNGRANGVAGGSKILLQSFAAVGDQPAISRFVLIESSGSGSVSRLDGSGQQSFNPGEFIDVENIKPPVISAPQTYVASSMPETESALASAEAALEAEFPEQPET